MSYPLLYVGPMSKNCVDSIIEYNSINDETIGIIPSRRQIECKSLGGGYVNKWTTEGFMNYVSKDLKTIVQRDHGGPHQGNLEDDGVESLLHDLKSKIKIVHIDPWKKYSNVSDACDITFLLMKKCIEVNKDCKFEVGTEEAIRPMSVSDLEIFLSSLRNKSRYIFDSIVYSTVQSGTRITENRNEGKFNSKRSKKMCDLVRSFGLLSKEHNCDYLSSTDIKKRKNSGVDAFNIAPEFGVFETRMLFSMLEKYDLNDIKDKFINDCVSSKKWKKWLDSEDNDGEFLALLCGHYNFSTASGINCFKSVNFKCDFNRFVKDAFIDRFNEITLSMQAHND